MNLEEDEGELIGNRVTESTNQGSLLDFWTYALRQTIVSDDVLELLEHRVRDIS